MRINRDIGNQPLPRIAAICRLLSALCKLAFIVFIVWALFTLSIMCYSLTSSQLKEEMLPLVFAVPLIYAIYSANACLLPFILGKMLGDISEHRTPFTMKNAKRLLLLSFILLLYTALEALLTTVDSQFACIIAEQSIEVGNFISDFASNSGTTLNLFPLLMPAMFFALSYVFKYGVLLQQESDETL